MRIGVAYVNNPSNEFLLTPISVFLIFIQIHRRALRYRVRADCPSRSGASGHGLQAGGHTALAPAYPARSLFACCG